jgi:hypothetical protein
MEATTEMTFREMNLRVFRREPIPQVLFQPRFEPWFRLQRDRGTVPARYRNMTVRDCYDDIGCSMRYTHYFTGVKHPVLTECAPELKVEEKVDGSTKIRTYRTPLGDLWESHYLTPENVWRLHEPAIKSAADLKAFIWICDHQAKTFSTGLFDEGDRFVGPRGEPQFWVSRSPMQALIIEWMKLEDVIYALADAPELMEQAMQALDRSYDRMFAEIIASGRVKILNFGENLHEQYFSHDYFERYYVPWYEKRSGQLRQAGIFTYIHIDGYFHGLLKYLAKLPFDGIEALTPKPQGDATLEEIRDHCGDKILLDLIPAVYFMAPYTRDDLMACVEKIVAYFHPRLVLGVSDEVPEGGDQEVLERLRLVADWCRSKTPETPP